MIGLGGVTSDLGHSRKTSYSSPDAIPDFRAISDHVYFFWFGFAGPDRLALDWGA
jgi:hypothetical protein